MLRQRDPLSPSVFVIEVKEFNSLFTKAIRLEKLYRFQVGTSDVSKLPISSL